MAAEQLEPRELYDPEQVRRVVENVEDPETKAILYLAWETALTATEIASLRWQDVDLVKGKLHVDWREIPMSKEMIEFLREKSRKGTYVIKSRKGDTLFPPEPGSLAPQHFQENELVAFQKNMLPNA